MRIPIAVAALTLFVGSFAMAESKTITVAADGSGDFKTVQEAVAAAPENSDDRTVIHIKAGTYQGNFIVPKNKPKVTFEGEGAEKTILTWDRNVQDPKPPGADGFNPGVLILGNDFRAEKLAIENTSGNHGQALALRIDSDRDALKDCRIIGWQDTLMINNGRDYFENCYIAGRVDFIYGSATAWFENCEVHTRNGGHVTAASTPQDHPFGFVFDHCKITGDDVPWVSTTGPTTKPDRLTPTADLGRPWRPYASVIFMNCEIGDRISPRGWNNWGKVENEKTARYSEYHCTGPGADRSKRVAWSKELTDDEAAKITPANVIDWADGWKP